MFFDLLRQQDVLFKDIYKAIEKLYGVSNVDRLMDDFYPILCTLKDKIFEYVKDSVDDKGVTQSYVVNLQICDGCDECDAGINFIFWHTMCIDSKNTH